MRSGTSDGLPARLARRLGGLLARAGAERPEPQGAGREPVLERRAEVFGPGRSGFPAALFRDAFDPRRLGRCLDALPGESAAGAAAFLDLETCGLGDAPIFLAGIALAPLSAAAPEAGLPPAGTMRFESILAPDPAAEPLLIAALAEVLAGAGCWVTFNGRCFDLPRLRRRAFRHGLEIPECRRHVDLLRDVRRRWKGVLPDCRLSTVERRLLGLERLPGDVPGREVPERYRDYVRTGERRWIEPVIEHNRRDVLALAVLFAGLATGRWRARR